ncbi:MAG: transcriptional regulator PpsR [Alsobacter sp.]
MAKPLDSSLSSLQPFAHAADSLGTLDPVAASSLITASSDIALVLDADGVIRDVCVASPELAVLEVQSWIGLPWIDTVNKESRPKVQEVLADLRTGKPTRWRQVNHAVGSGPDIPIRYCGVRVASKGPTIVVGRDLRALAALQQRLVEAQLSMEREYARIRNVETRYRLLFQLAAEAVAIIDAGTSRIVDLNPAALKILGLPQKRAVGTALADCFHADSQQAVQSLLAATRQVGRIDDVLARLVDGRTPVLLSASLFRHDQASHVLVRLRPSDPGGAAASAPSANILQVIERLPDAFVVTDLAHKVLAANSAFLDLAQVATEQQVKGRPIEHWIGRVGVDLEPLFANLKGSGGVRNFETVLRGELEGIEPVEIAAVLVEGGDLPCIGFSIRSVGWRREAAASSAQPFVSAQQFTDLIGRVSLKDMVRETTDLIERLCIEAALEITRDNRASAAEMLGLSRQSLYSKLRRFGLGDFDSDEDAAPADD